MKNLKALIEKRNTLVEEMEALTTAALEETRAMTEEEERSFEDKKKEVEALDRTIAALSEETRKQEEPDMTKAEEAEERAFDAYIRSAATGETRALSAGDNGDIVPTRVARRIIEEVKVLAPILELADVYYVGGNLVFPVYTDAQNTIEAAYVEEFTELTDKGGTFATVELKGYVAGVLAKVSKSLINNTEFDLRTFVIRKVAEAIASFLNKEMVVGTSGKMQGITTTTNVVTAAGAAVAADDLIGLQLAVPQNYQRNAVFVMHPNTWAAVRKLKDDNKQYLIGGLSTLEEGKGYQLLGKRVLLDENMPTTGKAVVYGNMRGLAVKFANRLEMTVLREKFATQYAVGICAYVEADCKVVNNQMIAALSLG